MWNRRSFLGSVVASVLGLVGVRVEAKSKQQDWVRENVSKGLLANTTYARYSLSLDGLVLDWEKLRVGKPPSFDIPKTPNGLMVVKEYGQNEVFCDPHGRKIYHSKGTTHYVKVFTKV